VAWAEEHLAGDVSDVESFAIAEELIPLRTIGAEALREVVEDLPEALDLNAATALSADRRITE